MPGNLDRSMDVQDPNEEDCEGDRTMPVCECDIDIGIVDVEDGLVGMNNDLCDEDILADADKITNASKGVKEEAQRSDILDGQGPDKYHKCACKWSDLRSQLRSINKEDVRLFFKRVGVIVFDVLFVTVLLVCPLVSLHCLACFLWSTKAAYGFGIPLFILTSIFPCIVPCITCCCCCCERCKCDKRTFRGKPLTKLPPVQYGVSRRLPMITGCCGGYASVMAFALVSWYGDSSSTRPLSAEWSASEPVAVIGSGPSGLSAAWLLAKGGRDVTIFESLSQIGGHSYTWDESSEMNFDLGFIFNNVAEDAYKEFKLFAKAFDHELVTTALNTSSYYKERYWDNTYSYAMSHRHGGKIEEDIDHWMKLVNAPVSTIRYLMPLGIWTWLNGFSEEFLNGPLTAVMSVLFVTKMGMWKQSSQAALNYFRPGEGFCHFRYDEDKVQRGKVGSQYMWKKVLADMQTTGRVTVHLSKKATSLEKDDDLWNIGFSDGSTYGGFKDVILAIPAFESQKLVPGRGLESLLVNQIHYIDTWVTLHKDRNASLMPTFKDMPQNVDYFISTEPPQMSGFIAKIFGYNNSDIILSVHGWDGVEKLPIDKEQVMWETVWSHHGFTLWELYIARKLLPFFNDRGGIHYAGDWVFGVGHNDAIRAGVTAACAVGIPRNMSLNMPAGSHGALYQELVSNMCPEDR